jgi:hypoxia up-regulated 1
LTLVCHTSTFTTLYLYDIIVTNGQSKRRTPQSVTFYNGERSFGADSFALIARKPGDLKKSQASFVTNLLRVLLELTFTKFHRMIGKVPSHPLIENIRKQYFPYEIYANETSGMTSLKLQDTYYHPEELLAMMMAQAKAMTKDYGGSNVKDCVLTVPSYFTQHERSAIYAAADIADLNVLSLIEENTAAALHFGIDRVFDEAHNVVIYNMGASMIQVFLTYMYIVHRTVANKCNVCR